MRILTGGTAAPLFKNFLVVAAALLIAFFLGSTLFGTWLNYSPVPVRDSWLGMVDFYLKSSDDPLVWWAQHNEHRIFFSKLLFWLDMHYFDGGGLFLVPVNFFLLLLTWCALSAYANRLIGASSLQERTWIVAALGMFCVAWMQRKNIIVSFQSMFILVFLLPLLSFYCLARALDDTPHALRWRLWSILFAVASAYCLVNGVLVLPLLALLSWLCERSPRRALVILGCAAVSLGVFLVGYERSATVSLGIGMLAAAPLELIGFALAYLGGPFDAIFHRAEVSVAAGGVAVLLASYLFLTRSAYRNNPYALALFVYVGYIFATAGATAVGRQFLGSTFPTPSRYLTPTLIMWAALLILLLARGRNVAPWPAAVALVAVAALLLPPQLQAFKLDTGKNTPQTRAVAALALQLDINDINAKRTLVYSKSEVFEDIFKSARHSKVSIFSDKYAHAANLVGSPLQDAGGEPCSAQITFQRLVDENRMAYKVGGSLAPGSATTFRYLLFGDAQGLVKGVAIPGRDNKRASGEPGPLNFDGYIFEQPDFAGLHCLR